MALDGNAARVDIPPSEPETVSTQGASPTEEPGFAELPPYELPKDNPFLPPYLRREAAAREQAAPEAPNPFTPLSLPKQAPERRVSRMSTLPPIPGQRYSYTPESERVDSPLGTSWQSAQPDYQQAYWEHLQSVAPPQTPAPPEDALLEDEEPELYDERLPGQADEQESDEEWEFAPPEHEAEDEPEAAPLPPDLPMAYSPVPALPYADSRARAGIPAPYELYRQSAAPPPQPHLQPAPASLTRKAVEASRLQLRRFRAFLAPGRSGRAAVSPARVALLAVALGLSLFAVCSLGRIASEYSQTQQANRAWRESYYGGAAAPANLAVMPQSGATFVPTSAPTAAPTRALETQNATQPTAIARQTATPAPASMQRNYRQSYEENPNLTVSDRILQLRRENQDIIGWMKLGALEAPVMQRDNTYYQTHDRTGAYSALGAPYLHSAVSLKRPPENLLISGNSGGGAVFDELLRYENDGADYLRQNAFFTLDTVYESSQYVVFAVFQADTNPASIRYFSYASYLTFPTDKAFQSYVAAACARSLYRVAVDVAPTDGLCTLCTTGQSGGTSRLIVLARRLRSGESAAQAPQITLSE